MFVIPESDTCAKKYIQKLVSCRTTRHDGDDNDNDASRRRNELAFWSSEAETKICPGAFRISFHFSLPSSFLSYTEGWDTLAGGSNFQTISVWIRQDTFSCILQVAVKKVPMPIFGTILSLSGKYWDDAQQNKNQQSLLNYRWAEK